MGSDWLVENEKLIASAENMLSDLVAALLGDRVALGKICYHVLKSPFFLQQQLSWVKLKRFLDGVYDNSLNDNQTVGLALAARLSEVGTKEDNAIRLITYIDRAESLKKIDFFINATKCLLSDFISGEEFFRICKAISDTILEDLYYLRDNIQENSIPYNQNIQGLLTSGLVYMDRVGKYPTYSLTKTAYDVDRFAVSYSDLSRYPDPTKPKYQIKTVEVDVPFSFGFSDKNNDGNIEISEIKG